MKCCKEDTRELLVSLIIALIHSGIFPDCKIEKSNKREEQAVLLSSLLVLQTFIEKVIND